MWLHLQITILYKECSIKCDENGFKLCIIGVRIKSVEGGHKSC